MLEPTLLPPWILRLWRAYFLFSCFPLQRVFLQAQQETNDAALEEDLLLEDEIAAEEELEAPLHAELLHTAVPFEVTEAEQEAVKVYKLDRVPPSLEAQFTAFRDWRLEALNYQRAGNAVVDVTQANDRSTTLRFLAHCKAVKDLEPSLSIFGMAAMPDLVQDWLKHANERGLMWSTLANCERVPIAAYKPLSSLVGLHRSWPLCFPPPLC